MFDYVHNNKTLGAVKLCNNMGLGAFCMLDNEYRLQFWS